MLMKKRMLNLLIGFVSLTACQSAKETSEMGDIHPDKFVETQLKLSDVAERLDYIPMDTTWLIRGSWDMELTDKYIFIAARDELLQYGRDGKFIKTIGSRGQGPGEFSSCTNIALDVEGERIFVKDGERVMVYSFEGEFWGHISLPLEGMVDVNYANGNLYGVSMVSFTQEQLPYLWMKVNALTGEVLQEKMNAGIKFETDGMTLRCNYTCRSTEGTILYYNHLNDTIFRLGKEQDEVAYLFGKGDFRLTPKNAGNGEYHLELKDIWDSGRYLFIDYRMDGKRQLCIHDKEQDIFRNDPDGELENDMDGLLPFKFRSTHIVGEDSYMAQFIPAETMKERLLESEDPKLKAWGESMKFDDNDILVLARLKK